WCVRARTDRFASGRDGKGPLRRAFLLGLLRVRGITKNPSFTKRESPGFAGGLPKVFRRGRLYAAVDSWFQRRCRAVIPAKAGSHFDFAKDAGSPLDQPSAVVKRCAGMTFKDGRGSMPPTGGSCFASAPLGGLTLKPPALPVDTYFDRREKSRPRPGERQIS